MKTHIKVVLLAALVSFNLGAKVLESQQTNLEVHNAKTSATAASNSMILKNLPILSNGFSSQNWDINLHLTNFNLRQQASNNQLALRVKAPSK